MANGDKWIITNKSGSPAIGNDLNGLLIKETASSYELYGVVGRVQKNQLPVKFEDVTFDGEAWDITIIALPSSTDAGSWVTPSQAAMKGKGKDVPPQSGEFTAQSGGQIVPAEKAASSGNAS